MSMMCTYPIPPLLMNDEETNSVCSDSIIRQYHFNVKTGRDAPLLPGFGKLPDALLETNDPAAKDLKQEVNEDAAKCC